VYPNGAEEIKTHKFFQGIAWSQMHLGQPPFVPRVKENQSITKYFEDEKDIISDDSSSFQSLKERIDERASDDELRTILGSHYEKWKAERIDKEKRELGIEDCSDTELDRIKAHFGPEFERWKAHRIIEVCETRAERGVESKPAKGKKEKKRPRDKMLRDPEVARKVMELRKRNAFFGYTYRRPKQPMLEKGRKRCPSVYTRPTILPVEVE
jgi:hypothetical protein